MKQVNILKLAKTISNELRRQGLRQYKDIYTKGGICFYCLNTCSGHEVKEELKDCILCPHCSIDALIPKDINITITPQLLELFNLFAFKAYVDAKGNRGLMFKPTLED